MTFTFRERFPGGRFEVRWLRRQHRQLLVEWAQFDAEGSELVTGHSFATVDETDRLALIAGFWAPGLSEARPGPPLRDVRSLKVAPGPGDVWPDDKV